MELVVLGKSQYVNGAFENRLCIIQSGRMMRVAAAIELAAMLFGYTEHPKHRIGPFRTEERARDYFKKYIEKYIWDDIKNITFKPVPLDKKKRTD
jgi:hypothetical protein